MGTTLTGLTPATTYDALIKVTDNGPLGASLKTLTDGLGNDSALALSTGAATVTGTLSATSLRSGATGSFGFNTANNGEFQIYAEAVGGMVLAGRGSTNDMIITNKNGGDVFRIPTGTINASFVGNVGIGTSSPAYKLVLQSESTSYTTSPSIAFYDTVVTSDARNWMVGNIATDYGSFNIASSTSQGGVPHTPRFTINKDGNVGIGTSTASRVLTLKNNTGSTNGISFQSSVSTSEIAAIECNQSLDTIDLEMVSNYSDSGIRFLVGSPLVEQARVTASGISITSGNLALSASGGIYFDNAASKYLDDYEVGSFTPTIIGSTTAGTATYGGGQVGTYTKIGNVVYFQIYLGYSGGTGTGNLRIAGLPFTIPANDLPSFTFGAFHNVALTALNIPIAGGIASTNEIIIEQIPTGGGSQTAVPYDASAVIQISGFYRV